MIRLPRLGVLTAAMLVLGACGEQPTAPRSRQAPPPAFAIQDGAHNGGNPGFFLLPPLVASPSGDAEFGDASFAASAAPRVEICQLASDPNAGPANCVAGNPLLTFSGSGVTVSPPIFQVNWKTDEVALNTSAFYRIQVLVGTQLMGFADIDPVSSSRDLKLARTGEAIPLLDGRTLPIKFTIETDALCPTTRPCTKARVTDDGGAFTLPSGTGGILLQDGWLPAGIGEVTLTLEDVALGPDNLCHAPGGFDGAGLVRQFEGCMAITTEPALTLGPTTGIQRPAIIGVCIESEAQSSAFRPFLRLFKSDPGYPLFVLADADPSVIPGFSCEGYTGSPLPPPVIGLGSNPVKHYASAGLDYLLRRVARVFDTRAVYAVDLGAGGELPIGQMFSRFGWGTTASLAAIGSPSQSTQPGQQVAVSILATGLVDHETPRSQCEGSEDESEELGCVAVMPGLTVTFAVTGGGGTVGGSATFTTTTGPNGVASATWTMGASPGINTLVVTGAAGSTPLVLTANALAATSTVLRSTFSGNQLSVVGDPVFLEATVAQLPTGGAVSAGQVEFLDGTTSLGTAALAPNGTASMTVPGFGLASHALTATYLGTATHAPSTSPVFALDMVQRFTSATAYQAALGGALEQTQAFSTFTVGAPITSIIPGVLNVASPFPDLEVASCSGNLAMFGVGNANVDPRRQLTEGGFVNSFYDLLFAVPRNALAFDIASMDPAASPAVVEMSALGTTTARFDVGNTSGDETTPVFVGMIASRPLSRVIVHEGLEPNTPAPIAEEMCLDNFRVSTTGGPP